MELYQAGKKWGIKIDEKVVVPPLYCSIAKPIGIYCAFEQIPNHWGVMTIRGKVVVEPKYDKVKVTAEGMAILSDVTGKTQTINLK